MIKKNNLFNLISINLTIVTYLIFLYSKSLSHLKEGDLLYNLTFIAVFSFLCLGYVEGELLYCLQRPFQKDYFRIHV